MAIDTTPLEWETKSAYALTELALFSVTSLVVITAIYICIVMAYLYTRDNSSFFSTLRPLFENVLPTAIAFTPTCPAKKDETGQESTEGEGLQLQEESKEKEKEKNEKQKVKKISVVFLGRQECREKNILTRVWVHMYFVLLCLLIILWAISVFSDSVLYRKTSTCNDLDVEDTDLSCFQLSTRNVPEGVQQIIDEEEGELVPCEKVQNYTQSENIDFDLEVICYQTRLNLVAALGIAYGSMKVIAFTIISILSFILNITKGIRDRPEGISKPKVLLAQITQIVLSLMVIGLIIATVVILHQITGPRNSSFDYLRGEQFYQYSIIVLAGVTIFYTVGLFPWWAFEPLDNPKKYELQLLDKDHINKQLHILVHNMVLHQKFSTGIATILQTFEHLGDAVNTARQGQEESRT